MSNILIWAFFPDIPKLCQPGAGGDMMETLQMGRHTHSDSPQDNPQNIKYTHSSFLSLDFNTMSLHFQRSEYQIILTTLDML